MKKVILIRCGEIMLKGLNRPAFENKLVSNIRKAVKECGKANVFKSQSRIYAEPIDDEFNFDLAFVKISKVFGVVSSSPAYKIESNFDVIKEVSAQMIREKIGDIDKKTFKVQTRRGNKSFPMDSMEVSCELGAHILKKFPNLTVDVHNPDFKFFIDVREYTYLYFEVVAANGGMPTGTNGRALLLLSGGIDSPVAGWMIAKRGVSIDAVHFYSYPYTSERAKEKVISLAKIMTEYCGKIRLHIVPFTDIQLAINEKCEHELSTIIMRRVMMNISETIARKSDSLALVTGESIGQVASQTIHSLFVTDSAVNMPVFRPLIGMDKNEVIKLAKNIGTFETSILPYEDCCTVFVPKHPKTKPNLEYVIQEEAKANLHEMINEAVANTEIIVLGGFNDIQI